MATSGLAVVLSGLTVIASLTGIYLINTPVLRSMATGAILAVAFAVLTSITLIPAVLATFGRAAARRSSLLQWSRRPEATQSRFWTRWVGWVMRRPWASALAATIFLLLLAAPAFSMVLGNSMQRQFPATHEVRAGVSSAAQALGPGALGPVRVLVTFPDGNAASAPAKEPLLDAVRQEMTKAPTSSRCRRRCSGTTTAPRCSRRCCRWTRRTWPPGTASTGCAPTCPGHRPGGRADRRRRPHGTDQGLRRPGVEDRALVFGFVALIAFVMLLISIRSVFLAFKGG